ncbi:Pre-mRNA-splicing factor 18 [Smittium culicis]|uniref:Pre-mRNA-splicing factor 18 n=1 Tax=Smittium culicis TaxID=133412 RepID=A0A1R1XH75_9FUNG|nr:Pre-mRNA-splicing factor 18 [Smittium culicis]
MDFLKSTISSEIKKRKQNYSSANQKLPASKKYVTAKELDRAAFENSTPTSTSTSTSAPALIPTSSDSAVSTAASSSSFRNNNDVTQVSDSALSNTNTTPQNPISATIEQSDELEAYNLSEVEIIKRLRSRNEPIRLFAETDRQRKLRLRTLELIDDKTSGQTNDFMKAIEDLESGSLLEDLKKKANLQDELLIKRSKKAQFFKQFDTSLLSLKLLQKDPDQTHSLVYAYFKKMLYEWDELLQQRPDAERNSTQGRLAAATQIQSSEYMKPFFRLLKKKTIDYNVLARITEIAMFMQQREYVKANDAYLRLAIGNSPWPIGVTMVGIHERSARENINASKVARKSIIPSTPPPYPHHFYPYIFHNPTST